MNTKSLLPWIAGAALLCGGCEGNGPNTQNGAVAGGALGALAGGIIGHNSGGGGGGNTLAGALIGGTVGALAGGTLGNSVDHQNGTLYHSEYDATSNVAVEQVPEVPAAPADYQPPQPTPSAIWVGGYYAWDGYRYVWVAGNWVVPPPGYVHFVRPHWIVREGRYVYVRAYWR